MIVSRGKVFSAQAVALLWALAVLLWALRAAGAEYEFTYSVAGHGVARADIEAFGRTIAAIYTDPRGWSLGGSVKFRPVAHGGDFTVWLAASSAMTSFGAGCSSQWNCRSGRDVIINQARWLDGSPKWPGPLYKYRIMIVNHETGHWLGFDHAECEEEGAPAPVMMQQSKGVGACLPNPWPTQAERGMLLQMLERRT